jgi:twitching motility two-component system response regulator PilH
MCTILVIDDNVEILTEIKEILLEGGFSVLEAMTGKQAKEMIGTQDLDLVITDVVMPEMTGYEICRWIREESRNHDLPVIICSGKNETIDRYWGMKQGADAYIAKPFELHTLLDTIKLLLPSKTAS